MDREQFKQQIEQHTPELLRYARTRAKEPLVPAGQTWHSDGVRTQFAAEEAVNTAVADLLKRREWERCAPGHDLWRFLKRAVRHRLQRGFKRHKNDRERFHDGTLFYEGDDGADNESRNASEWAVAHDATGNMQPEFIVHDLARPDEPGMRAADEPSYVPRASWPAWRAKELETLHAVRLDLMRAFEAANVPLAACLALWPFQRTVRYAPEPASRCECGAPRHCEIDGDGTVEVTSSVCGNGHREQTVRQVAAPDADPEWGERGWWGDEVQRSLPKDEYRNATVRYRFHRRAPMPRDPEKAAAAEAAWVRRLLKRRSPKPACERADHLNVPDRSKKRSRRAATSRRRVLLALSK